LNALFENLRRTGARLCGKWTISRATWKFNYSCLTGRRSGGDRNAVLLRCAAAMVLCLAFAPAALAAGIDSCEKIKDADAYNACLANYGPAVGDHKFAPAPPAAAEAEAPRPGQHRTPARRNARAGVEAPRQGPKRQANGRVRIEIFPGQ
jgi:hypothetical protein